MRNGRFNRHPLAEQHSGGRHQHGRHAYQHDGRRHRHAEHYLAHVLDVAAADLLLNGSNAEEEQTFRHRVEAQNNKARHVSQRRSNPRAHDNQAQVCNSGIRQHALGVVL